MSALCNPGREGILDETIKMNSGDIRFMLVKSTYVFNAADKFISNLGAVDNGRSASLSGKNFTDGIFDAADTSLAATAAVACNAGWLFQHTGSDATARLIAYIDGVTGLPATPSAGQTVSIAWSNATNKIFKV